MQAGTGLAAEAAAGPAVGTYTGKWPSLHDVAEHATAHPLSLDLDWLWTLSMDTVLWNTVVRVLLFLPVSLFFFSFVFKLKIAGVVLGTPKVYHFYGTKIHLSTRVNQSAYGNWEVVVIPWMCLSASEMASYEKSRLVFETERCGFVTL